MSLLKARFYASVSSDDVIQDFGMHGDFYNHKGKSTIVPWMFLFGGHWYHPKNVPERLDRAVYILRDGIDTIYSTWTLLNSRKDGSPGPLDDYIQLNTHAVDPNPIPVGASVAAHWHWSTKLWMVSDALIIRYEDLLQNHRLQLDRVETRFNLRSGQTNEDPAKIPVGFLIDGVCKGVGAGRKNFPESSIAFFNNSEKEADAILAKDPWYQERAHAP